MTVNLFIVTATFLTLLNVVLLPVSFMTGILYGRLELNKEPGSAQGFGATLTYPRILRLLRIATTTACLIECGLLIWLWVRSYSWIDSIHGTGYAKSFWCESLRGELGILLLTDLRYAGQPRHLELWAPRPPAQVPYYSKGLYDDWPTPFSTALGIRWTFVNGFGVVVPCWMPVVLLGTPATIPWIPWSIRFSLRTLLLATTLVAVVLGLLVAMR
jgi:hypothetical protein